MARNEEVTNMALFCDFENVALGVRDTAFDRFDINLVLERLLLKGDIVVKKAYCDWSRYKEFKRGMHEASFELIDIPHLRQSGKNSADIRMVVDALDLCYTKEHLDSFVIVSGDSDFSPLVSKLRENNKTVIGVGVKNSTSDLFVANCDEFIFYDDMARRKPSDRSGKGTSRASDKDEAKAKPTPKAGSAPESVQNEEQRKSDEAVDLVLGTIVALIEERGEEGKLWGSMIKQAIKRRNPGFNESFYGYPSFSRLLEEAEARGLLELERDEKSGGYIIVRVV